MSTQFNFTSGESLKLTCFACNINSRHDQFCDYLLADGNRVFLYRCSRCRSIQAVDFQLPDYALEADGDWATNYYCQVGAGLDFIIKPVYSAVEAQPGNVSNFLDVGSGFGFAAHYAETKGLNSICIEPGEYGRIGSQVLGLKVLDEYLTENNSKVC